MKNILPKLLFQIKLFLASESKKAEVYSGFFKVNMGKRVRITGIPTFGSEPYLITIGDDVTITNGVIFHTHDGGVGILRNKYPGINVFKPTKVGDNVFIGSNTTILPGITIGNNVVIGASSVVTKDIPDNVVVAGVPAKVLHSLDDYEAKVLKEAVFITETDPYLREKKIRELVLKENK
jgi:acetyltransferase-like isoleucine patch superfamily enzyme